MLDTIIAFLWGSDMGSQTFVDSPFPQQNAASFIDLIYETADGYISVAVQSDREWQALTRAVDRPDWLEDERFKTPALRQENIDDRLNFTQEMLRTAPSAEWLARLEAEDVPCAPVLTRSEAIRHPQVAANAIVLETDHHLAGRVRQARPAAQFSETPLDTFTGGPGLGEHTREVLAEAGCSEETIAALAEPPRDRVK
jgi:crotonobetainyl-CoA:carnitine CoA-transferase CaiB-like acyl-CoA transferase